MTESLVFSVALEAPEEVQVAGRRWFRRPEFHVTTFNPDDLAAATGHYRYGSSSEPASIPANVTLT